MWWFFHSIFKIFFQSFFKILKIKYNNLDTDIDNYIYKLCIFYLFIFVWNNLNYIMETNNDVKICFEILV